MLCKTPKPSFFFFSFFFRSVAPAGRGAKPQLKTYRTNLPELRVVVPYVVQLKKHSASNKPKQRQRKRQIKRQKKKEKKGDKRDMSDVETPATRPARPARPEKPASSNSLTASSNSIPPPIPSLLAGKTTAGSTVDWRWLLCRDVAGEGSKCGLVSNLTLQGSALSPSGLPVTYEEPIPQFEGFSGVALQCDSGLRYMDVSFDQNMRPQTRVMCHDQNTMITLPGVYNTVLLTQSRPILPSFAAWPPNASSDVTSLPISSGPSSGLSTSGEPTTPTTPTAVSHGHPPHPSQTLLPNV